MTKSVKFIWSKWLKIAHTIGNFQGQVILTIFYFIFLWPPAIAIKFFLDPLKLKAQRRKSSFNNFIYEDKNTQQAQKQY